MENFTRFAIYVAPQPAPWAEYCTSWLGWDAVAGRMVPPPDVAGLPAPLEEITRTPRKYGLHGTIKPPFRLAGSRAALEADLADLCAHLAPVTLDGLALHRLGGFIALTPQGDQSALAHMAARVVMELDHHRAPPNQAELERRRKAPLSARHEALLAQWGYPYVLDEFRFHLTLSGLLSPEHAPPVEAALRRDLVPLLPSPFEVRDLCLFGEAQDGRFHLLHRYTLSG